MSARANRRLTIGCMFMCLAGCSSGGQSQSGGTAPMAVRSGGEPLRWWLPPAPQPDARLTFRPLDFWIAGSEITLSGGQKVPVENWRAILIAELGTGPNAWMNYCTATLVGPRTVLTAAHCIDGGNNPVTGAPVLRTGDLTVGGRRFGFTCDMHPDYARYPLPAQGGFRSSHDYALCRLESAVDTFVLRPESISADPPLPEGARLLLTGYGCTNIRPDQGSQQGFTYTPAATADQRTLQMGIGSLHDKGIAWGQEVGVWTRSRSALGKPTICPGDSGGPVVIGSEPAGDTRGRRVSAVNSGVALAYEQGVPFFYSYFAPLATSSFREFLRSYVRRHAPGEPDLVVCGFNRTPGQGGCRD